MGFSLFLRFDAYQACAYVEKDYLLDDILDAAAELVQKLVGLRFYPADLAFRRCEFVPKNQFDYNTICCFLPATRERVGP
ncbi:hypothetical protein CLF_108525 [Clonorchis sinensis]|uniref:Uncharacterized protein n=1 Tax=Clonorchis sinensis TaxID=79923 RepID=G7YRP1_CLOSI|nr:hypothetical protein CLF_108525 [Clonorchis sinensis]